MALKMAKSLGPCASVLALGARGCAEGSDEADAKGGASSGGSASGGGTENRGADDGGADNGGATTGGGDTGTGGNGGASTEFEPTVRYTFAEDDEDFQF